VIKRGLIWLLISGLSGITKAQDMTAQNDSKEVIALHNRAYQKLNLPSLSTNKKSKPVVVAVIDDAFRVTHKQLAPYLLHNTSDILGNGIDDDFNGLVDDAIGWDFANRDNDVSMPTGSERRFFHGTMTAGIIASLAEQCYGKSGSSQVKIVPYKALADGAENNNMELGYEALTHAVRNGNVDIICLAWSGGRIEDRYLSVFDEAAKKGIMIIGSAGNFYSQQVDPPASMSEVFTVAAIDTFFRKVESSNYGRKVDISAFGEQVRAPHPLADSAWFNGEATSAACALVAGCAAILKSQSPESGAKEIGDALKNTAFPVDEMNPVYSALLGAGVPNLTDAIAYLKNKDQRPQYFRSDRPEGLLILNTIVADSTVVVKPEGGIKTIHFQPIGLKNPPKGAELAFYSNTTLVSKHALDQLPSKIAVPSGHAQVVLSGKRPKEPIMLRYDTEPVDSTTLYCTETVHLTALNGDISDGSLLENYANRASCKWQITAPKGQRVRIDFKEIDTQSNVDFIWIFDGTGTLQESILAKFSGTDLPPTITTLSNEVLIWFVTDKTVTGQGWTLHYAATDAPPGVEVQEINAN
jgi:hypothetical protein